MQCSQQGCARPACPRVAVCTACTHKDDFHRRNPWIEKAKATADFGDDEYMVRGMLYIWHLICEVYGSDAASVVLLDDALTASPSWVRECRRWYAWSLPSRRQGPSH